MEGNRIEHFDLDAVVRQFQEASRRAFEDERLKDAVDFLIAEQIVCVIRGDFREEDAA